MVMYHMVYSTPTTLVHKTALLLVKAVSLTHSIVVVVPTIF